MSFFLRTGPETFHATEATQGPWDPNAMHGGPPAALLAELLSRRAAELSPTLRLARLSVDFLGGLPLGDLTTAVTVPRPGKRVALLEATLSASRAHPRDEGQTHPLVPAATRATRGEYVTRRYSAERIRVIMTTGHARRGRSGRPG